MPLDDRLHPLEVAGEQLAQRLRVDVLAESGRARHVAEQDRDRLALLARRPRGRDGRAAGGTERELGGQLAPARCTGGHRVEPSLRAASAATPRVPSPGGRIAPLPPHVRPSGGLSAAVPLVDGCVGRARSRLAGGGARGDLPDRLGGRGAAARRARPPAVARGRRGRAGRDAGPDDVGAAADRGPAGARRGARHAHLDLREAVAALVRVLRPPPDGAADEPGDGRPAGRPLLPRLRPDLLLPAHLHDPRRRRRRDADLVEARADRAGDRPGDRRRRLPLQPRLAPAPPRGAAEDGGRRDRRRGEHRRRPRGQVVRAGGLGAAEVRTALGGRLRPLRAGEPAARLLHPGAQLPAAACAGGDPAGGRTDGGRRIALGRELRALQPLPRDAGDAAEAARHVDRAGTAGDRLRRADLPGDRRARGDLRRRRRTGASRRAGADHVRARDVRLRPRAAGARGDRPRPRGRQGGRADRAHRRRQDDAGVARAALLRRAGGTGAGRRRRRALAHDHVAAASDRRDRPGPVPLLRHGAREHCVRPGGRDRRGRRARGTARAGPRVHRGPAGRLRHGRRRAWDHALGRTAPARRDRTRARARPTCPDPRRRDRVGRRDDRVEDPRRAARGDAQAGRRSSSPTGTRPSRSPTRSSSSTRAGCSCTARTRRPSASRRCTARSSSTGSSSGSSRRRSRREGAPARLASDARRPGRGRRLVVGADEAPPAGALPPRPPVPRTDAARGRLAARGDGGRPGAAVPGRPRRRRGEARQHPCAGVARRRLRRRRRARHRLRLRADLLHRLDGRADARRPPQRPLPAPAAALARLLRAQPGRGDHQPADERRRGARPARHRRRDVARPEHADPRRHRGGALLPRLAPRARHLDRDAGDGARHRVVPQALRPRLPARARDARRRHRHARRGHRGHAGAPVVHARADRRGQLRRRLEPLPGGQHADRRPERALLPGRRLPLLGGDGGRARLRRLARLQRQRLRRDARRLPRAT